MPPQKLATLIRYTGRHRAWGHVIELIRIARCTSKWTLAYIRCDWPTVVARGSHSKELPSVSSQKPEVNQKYICATQVNTLVRESPGYEENNKNWKVMGPHWRRSLISESIVAPEKLWASNSLLNPTNIGLLIIRTAETTVVWKPILSATQHHISSLIHASPLLLRDSAHGETTSWTHISIVVSHQDLFNKRELYATTLCSVVSWMWKSHISRQCIRCLKDHGLPGPWLSHKCPYSSITYVFPCKQATYQNGINLTVRIISVTFPSSPE